MTTRAQSSESTISIHKTEDFEITGDGSAKAWNNTAWIKLDQRKNLDHMLETKLKILYSETGMYFLFSCADDQITATMEQDFADLWHEDVVEVFLWTDQTYPLYFEYELSPLNYELPLLIPNFGGEFLGWIPWHYTGDRRIIHATKVLDGKKTNNGKIVWYGEFFIPYKLLEPLQNVPPKKGTTWRGNFYRMDYDHGHSVWSWQLTDGNFHEYEKFGKLKFQ